MTVETFIRLPELQARIGLKRTAIYDAIKAGSFPHPVKLGTRAVAWVESEIVDWQQAQMARRDGSIASGQ